MTADIYIQQQSQDLVHGTINREWVFSKRIPVHIDIVSGIGANTPDNNKSFGVIYTEEEKILMKSKDPLSKRFRVTAIKNRAGEMLFVEQDKIDSPPTIFEINSYHPRLDPLGNILYYESNLRRVGVQDG